MANYQPITKLYVVAGPDRPPPPPPAPTPIPQYTPTPPRPPFGGMSSGGSSGGGGSGVGRLVEKVYCFQITDASGFVIRQECKIFNVYE